MAYPTDSVPINRSTVELPEEVSREIFAAAEGQSAVMQLAQRIDLPGRGLSIPVVTGDPVAQVVEETAEKPVSNSELTTKNMRPLKFAAIELFSNEFRRDASALYEELVRRLPGAIARAFDGKVFGGPAVSGFDSFRGENAPLIQNIDGTGDTSVDIVAAIQAVAANGYTNNGFIVSPLAYAKMLTALDGVGRPLFVPNANDGANVGSIFGAKVVKSDGPDDWFFAGDWSTAKYGIVDGINISFSEDATVNDGENQINLWQRNMFAVRVEAEIGFVYSNSDAFVYVVGNELPPVNQPS